MLATQNTGQGEMFSGGVDAADKSLSDGDTEPGEVVGGVFMFYMMVVIFEDEKKLTLKAWAFQVTETD